jgi:putative DNA primase/helicase
MRPNTLRDPSEVAQAPDGRRTAEEIKARAAQDPEAAFAAAGYSNPLKRDGHNLTGLCPFHAESTPSFKITLSGQHAGLWKCFGCNAGGDVIALRQKLTGETFLQAVEALAQALGIVPTAAGPRREAPAKPPPERPTRTVAERIYQITDQTGEVVAEHGRWDKVYADTGDLAPKGLAWRLPGGTWKTGLGGLKTADLPFYNLPALLAAAPGEPVFLVEGEKTCDALTDHGFLAVATVTGAGNPIHNDAALEFLLPRKVFSWRDHDAPGQKHMDDHCARLADLGTVPRVIEWAGAQEKGDDAADFFARGGTAEELRAMMKAAEEWQPAIPAVAADRLPGAVSPSDLGNARRLVAAHGEDLRYCFPARKWHVWTGTRWQEDQTGEVERRAKDTVAQIGAEAARTADEGTRKALLSHALKSESEAKRKAMIASAQSEPGIPVLPEEFDADPMLLNCESGLIDLRTLSLQPHRREALCTKRAPVRYDPDADCPLWRAFLQRVTGGDLALQEFLQRAVGYTLTGSAAEEVFFLLYGTGQNGKTVFLETLQSLLGDYGRKCDFASFLQRRDDGGPRNDLAALAGARLAVAVEADAGKRLAEALVKEVTGGDAITARFLYAEPFTFHPQFKLWLAANYRPVIRGTDYAMWRRIQLVPFTVTIPEKERDRKLKEKLLGELPGVLAWALEGCAAWQKYGLGGCEAVSRATGAYREESDVLAEFLGSECVQGPTAQALSRDLYARYGRWCETNGERPLSQKAFGQKLEERGFWPKRGTGGVRRWEGVGLLTEQK